MSKPQPVDDPHLRIPASVLAAGKRSEDLIKASQNPPVDEPPVESKTDEPPAPPPQNPAPAQNPAPKPPSAQDPNWEHRFNSMKGRYEQAQQQAQSMAQQIADMQRVIATLQAAPPAPPQQSSELRFVTPKEEEEYGKEFIDVVGKRAREVVTPEVTELKAKLAKLEAQMGNVENVAVQTQREKMFTALDQTVPNWREINSNQSFLDWLKLPDAYSGAIRHGLLMNAFNANNANRVAAFFRGYLADEAATRPVDTPTQRTSAHQPSKVDLATLAAPGRAKQAAANAPVDKPTITRAQITQFYRDVAAGVYSGRDDQRIAREKEIFAASTEGRVVS